MKRYVYMASQDDRADVHLETDDLKGALGWARGRAQELAACRSSTRHVVGAPNPRDAAMCSTCGLAL